MNDSKVDCSVVVITKNEASRLAACLDSAAWAREIIVVDDDSEDGTLEVARRYTDRVVTRRMDVEGKHRNYAYALATQPWILSLDADERVTLELAAEIRKVVEKNPDCNGYTIPRKNFMGDTWVRYGGMYPSRQLKLFRRGAFKYEEDAEVHPQAFMQDPRGELQGDILHYTYSDFTDAIAKLDRQTDLEARKWFREKRKIGLLKTLRRMIDRFFKAYVVKNGRKDGVIGLFLAVNAGMYQFLSYVKYWELLKREAAQDQNRRDGAWDA